MSDPFRRVARTCYVLAIIIVLYWVLWYSHRSLVASENSKLYVNFEQAFPLADGFIVVCLVLAALSLQRRAPTALLFLLVGTGAGFYLCAMDVLFDLEHGIWGKGANGVVELCINVLTLLAASVLSRWTWSHRRELDPRGERSDAAG
ncbi:MAG: hypothetical protein ABR963_07130 [Acidimicrobiales bacterium]